jgi:hypothetical protein
MLDFDFQNATRLVFGKGRHKEIGALLKPLAKKVMISHYGDGVVEKLSFFNEVIQSFKENEIEYIDHGGVEPNPKLTYVNEGIDLCRKENVDLILAIGGGSVIDSCKAIAMGVFYDGDYWEMVEKRIVTEKVLPIAVVLTLPGSGSESSPGGSVTNEAENIKSGVPNEKSRPFMCIINPELFYSIPKKLIGYGVIDMFSHVFERYFTNITETDLTDELCEATMRTIIKNGPVVLDDPTNYDAWCQVGFASTFAHNGFIGMGREVDWACHDMEREVNAFYDLPHGAGLAILMPSWMEYVYKDNIGMFVQFAVNVMGVQQSFRDQDAICREGIKRLREFCLKMGLPTKLSQFGVEEDKLEMIAKRLTGYDTTNQVPRGNLKKLFWQDVLAIFKAAY